VSYLHPVYLAPAERWLARVSEVLAPFLVESGGPIILWQLDNEVGMLQWDTNQADFHPLVVGRFQEAALPDADDTALSRFWRWQTFQQGERHAYLKALQDSVAPRINVPFIVNVHGFRDFYTYGRGIDYPIGLAQLVDARQLTDTALTGDFYPGKVGYDNYHDLVLTTLFTQAVNNRDRLAYSAEFQSGRLADRPRLSFYDIELATRLVVAHGINGVNYYMFSGGDNPDGIGSLGRRHDWQAVIAADGSLRPSYNTVQYLGSVFRAMQEALVGSDNLADVTIGYYSPYYLTDTIPDNVSHEAVIERVIHDRTRLHFDGIYRILTALSVPIRAAAVKETALSPETMPVLWLATTPYLDADTTDKLLEYVQAGGHLILGPDIPRFDLQHRPLTSLIDAFGIADIQEQSKTQLVTALGIDSVLVRRFTTFRPPTPSVVLASTEDLHQSCAASWPSGAGRVTVIGMGLAGDYTYQEEVVAQILEALDIARRLRVSPTTVHATLRTGPQGTFLSIINPDDQDCTVTVESPLLPETLTLTVWGRRGALLPVHYAVQDLLEIACSTAEVVNIEVSVNDVSIEVNAMCAGHMVLHSHRSLAVSTGGDCYTSRTDNGDIAVCWSDSGTHFFRCESIETFQSAPGVPDINVR
jgi:beta-galactosidase